MAYRQRQKLSEATETAGAAQASDTTAAQAAGVVVTAETGARPSEAASAVQAPTTTAASSEAAACQVRAVRPQRPRNAQAKRERQRAQEEPPHVATAEEQQQEGRSGAQQRQESAPQKTQPGPWLRTTCPSTRALEDDFDVPDEDWEFTLPGAATYKAAGADGSGPRSNT
eukprot:3883398-Amphidinium_carterae.2